MTNNGEISARSLTNLPKVLSLNILNILNIVVTILE